MIPVLSWLFYKNKDSMADDDDDSSYNPEEDDHMSDTSYFSDDDMADDPEGDSLPYGLVDYHIEEELPEDKGKKI